MKKQGTTAVKGSRPAPTRASSTRKTAAVSGGTGAAKAPDPGHAAMERLAALVNDRWERRSRDYEEAKKSFESAARAVQKHRGDDAKGSSQVKKDLNHFGMEMRLQAARRAELDWARQVIEDPDRARKA